MMIPAGGGFVLRGVACMGAPFLREARLGDPRHNHPGLYGTHRARHRHRIATRLALGLRSSGIVEAAYNSPPHRSDLFQDADLSDCHKH